MEQLVMSPAPGQRLVRHVGDTLRFSIRGDSRAHHEAGWQARLRTDLARVTVQREEIIRAHTRSVPPFGASWHDVPLHWNPVSRTWTWDFVLAEPGYHAAKAYLIDPAGYQHWPAGPDVGISIHPDWCRTSNTVYCAFTRLFGATRTTTRQLPEPGESAMRDLERQGFAVLPPSGTFRDLTRQLPHIVQQLGCRILHLLPVHPTPTVHARFGRMGSPYAALDLTAVDPALVEFDRRSNGVDQFVELTRAARGLGARVFLDIVINHTGWGSRIFEEHPQFFSREPDGRFASPGAWGVVWEDLVELEQKDVALWDLIAESLLTWCRRGVDGFRCDAGYKIPTHVWQYITARVTLEFPDTVFLLEGLGGSWEATETLLGSGGMQWAYSELFQNHSGDQVQTYLDYALTQSDRVGTYIHYSETHDNDRLAALGRPWSLLRNRLCALTSVRGGFGFTAGVEWLATEKIRVHQRTGLAWGAVDNLVADIATLNRLLASHPAFFDGATLRRLSPPGSTAYVLERVSADGRHRCVVLANTSMEATARAILPAATVPPEDLAHDDLLGQPAPRSQRNRKEVTFELPPGHVTCLGTPIPEETAPDSGGRFRHRHSCRAFAVQTAATLVPAERIAIPVPELAEAAVNRDPAEWLATLSHTVAHARERDALLDLSAVADPAGSPGVFPNVVEWRLADARRITLIPPGWWILVLDEDPFTVHLDAEGDPRPVHRHSIRTAAGHVAWFAPRTPSCSMDACVRFDGHGSPPRNGVAQLRFLAAGLVPAPIRVPPDAVTLLTNGRGGMARLRIDLGSIRSKYDCALAANLHPAVPVDRHVFVKRIRAWLNAEGFISPLDRNNLDRFDAAPHPTWNFRPNAGNGRTVSIRLQARMIPQRNTTEFIFSRADDDVPLTASLTLRVDIEDRSFHAETHRHPDAERHFTLHSHPAVDAVGFDFTPAPDRQLRVRSSRGAYHTQPEWSGPIVHSIEASRGQTAEGDAFSPGWLEIPLAPGNQAVVTLDAESGSAPAPTPVPPAPIPSRDDFVHRLQAAAAAFVVRRDSGRTVIAGYPWFLDWGRDTLIAARGLLAAGWKVEVLQILETFGRFADRGTLPNSIHGDNAANRDTSDAPLWFAVLLADAAQHLGPEVVRRPTHPNGPTLLDVVRGLAEGYLAGTPNGIRVDPDSGLVWSPSHFTWMDTNHPAGTPREGYPIEIQALWFRTLQFLAEFDRPGGGQWEGLARQTKNSLQTLFWLPGNGWLSDVLLAPVGIPASRATPDNALRCNQLVAIAFGLAPPEQARACVAAAQRHLLVPGALRSLAPLPVDPPLVIRSSGGLTLNDPVHPYWGRYEGDEDSRRKPAYHNGTAWCWFLPIFAEAMAVAWNRHPDALRAARAILRSTESLLDVACLGHLPEIVDGDAPHTPRGCDAQAWSVTETLRVWHLLGPPP